MSTSDVRHLVHEQVRLVSGLTVEASLSVPPEVSAVVSERRLAICLHPWSWLGGRMSDPVLQSVGKLLLKHKYHVLKYNSRGVGKSSGWPSLTGMTEAQDLQDLVQWALNTITDVKHVLIFGYSHGSLVASLFPILAEPIQVSHILLSYPLGPRSWLTGFRSKHYATSLNTLLRDSRSNVLIIHGDQDEFTGVESYDVWADALEDEVRGEERGKLLIERVHGATHFWTDQTDARRQMLQAVARWVR